MRKLSLIFCFLAFFWQCKSSADVTKMTEPAPQEVKDNSRNTLDWYGTYSGILPCDDCMGKRTIIQLKEGMETEVTTIALGKMQKIENFVGEFSWDESGNRISYNDRNNITYYFRVDENQLVFDGHQPTDAFAEENQFILKKGGDVILDRLWTAVEIMGQSSSSPDEGNETEESGPLFQYILLRADGTFNASGGCNQMHGKYKLIEKNKISFSKIAMTEMACQFHHLDNELIQALEQTESFILPQKNDNPQNLRLQLVVGKRAPLAVFESINYPPQ